MLASRSWFLLLALLTALTALARDASAPTGAPVLDPPTLHCLGVYWIVQGDDNANARIDVSIRKQGAPAWRKAMPLFRVEKGRHRNERGESSVVVPDDAWLFAGSVLMLDPGTVYELKLALADPDGGNAETTLTARTMSEPAAPAGMSTCHVVPGAGGGTGSRNNPFQGLAAAQARAKPGTLFLLHAGVYPGAFAITASGAAGRPIIWRGAGDGEAIIDGQGDDVRRPERAISAVGIHDVWFENLTLRNANYAIVGHNSHDLVIRRCYLHAVDYGFTNGRNDEGSVGNVFIVDNLIEGPCTWPRTRGIENPRGIQVTGTGTVVCYNRIRGFADAIDTLPSSRCYAIDFHNNDISECTDDGAEMDYSERNTRNFCNRYTNVFQGISTQPILGGPVYIVRNVLYNVEMETFKMHNSPSGGILLHNTSVKRDFPLILSTGHKVSNFYFRNNLFIGTAASYAFINDAPMEQCDFDYDGFGGGPYVNFLKWNGVRYPTPEAVRARAPVYRHIVRVNPQTVFADGTQPPDDLTKQFVPTAHDLRLGGGSEAIDAGDLLPGINDGYAGNAPDLGAYEYGSSLPHYGPR